MQVRFGRTHQAPLLGEFGFYQAGVWYSRSSSLQVLRKKELSRAQMEVGQGTVVVLSKKEVRLPGLRIAEGLGRSWHGLLPIHSGFIGAR